MTVTPQEKRSQLMARVKDRKKLPKSLPIELIEQKIHEHSGNVNHIALDLDLLYYDLSLFIDRQPHLRLMIMRHREKLIDMAEDNLKSDLMNGDQKATFFTLKTIGKSRGYVERTENETRVLIDDTTSSVDIGTLSSDELFQLRGIMQNAKAEGAKVIDHDVTDDEPAHVTDVI